MYKRSEKCLVYTTFFAPPECCAAESQPVSNIRDEERFSGSGGGGFGLGVAKVSEKEISHMDHELPTHDIFSVSRCSTDQCGHHMLTFSPMLSNYIETNIRDHFQ